MKTITVKGIGSATSKADLVIITFRLSSLHKDYEDAMNIASGKINALTETLTSINFAKEDLKTTHFNVLTSYRNIKERNDDYRSVFEGYVVEQSLKLSFDFDTERLAETLSAISSGISDPQFDIRFTVKDPSKINEEVLRSATENARKKAEIIINASGKQLGDIVSIDYNWGEVDIFSNTRFNICENFAMPKICSINMEPEDVSLSDTVTFVYEIL